MIPTSDPAQARPPELRPGEPEAISVVGVSRSGTTLMRNILERSDRVALAPENHFLGHLLEREIPFALPAVLLVQLWTWAGAARRDRYLRRRYPDRYRLVCFEDVISEPDKTLPALFAFLGVTPPADRTAVKVYARGFQWGQEGLDSAAASPWREHIRPFSRRWLKFWLGSYMRRFGYANKRAASI